LSNSEVWYSGEASTGIDSSTNLRSGTVTVTWSPQEDLINLSPPQDVAHQEKVTMLNSHSLQEKYIPVCGNSLPFKPKDDCKSNIARSNKKFTGSIDDPDILDQIKKEFEKGDTGLMSCLSFFKEALAELKRVNKRLGVRIMEEDLLFKSLGEEINKQKAKLNEVLEVHRRSQLTSNAKAEAVQEKSTKRLSQEKIDTGCSSDSSTPKLILKINQLR